MNCGNSDMPMQAHAVFSEVSEEYGDLKGTAGDSSPLPF